MTSRDRVLCALKHEEPDRVPIFVGTSGTTTLLAPAYERLKAHLGIQAEPRLLSRALQYARLDEEVLIRLGSDGRPLAARPAMSTVQRDLSEDAFIDEWGITWRRAPGVLYYEVAYPPLRHATLNDLDRYPWPDLTHPKRFAGLAKEARALHEGTPYAVVAMSGVSPHEQIYLLRGLDTWLADLAGDPEFANALLQRVKGLMLAGMVGLLDEVGKYIDVLVMGDDLGMQDGPMMSPAMYRNLIKPCHAELIAAAKKRTQAKVFFHSDGNIYPLIGDLIDVGIDVLNPVQVSSRDMGDTARLKRKFGKHLSFCGAVDTQRVLPHGTQDDVRREVHQRIRDLGPGGGYILAAVHCIQPDVPPANVLAMCEEAARAGRYPLSGKG